MKIDQRLFDWYGIDIKKNLGIKTFCPKPFDTLLIDKQGSCFLCDCTAWLPLSVGNLKIQSIGDLFSATVADTIRNSIKDGSYRFCNNHQCSWLLDERQKHYEFFKKSVPDIKIKYLRLAIDDSCNLACPSCRIKKIFIKDKKRLRSKYSMVNKILEFLHCQNHNINIHIGSDGDPFASLIYRHFIKESAKIKNINYNVQTNGLLIKKMYQKNRHLFEKLKTLNVSIDGATKTTYENLRRGGSFENLIENLKFIKNTRSAHGFDFVLHFVVQKKNYKEIPLMIDLGREMGADKIWFNRITNWNTLENFVMHDVVDPAHPEHEHFKNIIMSLKETSFVEMPTLNV